MVIGAIYGKCIELGITYTALRPSQWRSKARNKAEKLPRKRDELKAWSIRRVKELFGINNIDDNIADAILLGYAYLTIS
jgi:hypothetical protein